MLVLSAVVLALMPCSSLLGFRRGWLAAAAQKMQRYCPWRTSVCRLCTAARVSIRCEPV